MARKKKAAPEAPPPPPTPPGQRPAYMDAVDAFIDADTEYKMAEQNLLSGAFIDQLMGKSAVEAKLDYAGLVQDLRNRLEERNSRLRDAQDLLRQQVSLAVTKWRGADGEPTELNAGPFKVSSVTFRSFDAKSLLDLTKQHGLLERLLDLTTMGDDGKPKKLVEQVYEIDYKGVSAWLKANKLMNIHEGAYDEREGTPQVKGPKPLSFLGDEVKK